VDAASVYWANYFNGAAGQGTVMKAGLGGGPPYTTLASGQNGSAGIAMDATSVYWTNYFASGTVMKVPRSGGSATVLASGQSAPHGIAVDATSVYWTNYAGGTVVKLTK
jgi:hypothetical protein